MKTALEILTETESPYEHIANEAQFDHLRIDLSLNDAIKAMKLYANQKLDEVLNNRFDVEDEVPYSVVSVGDIRKLKDKV